MSGFRQQPEKPILPPLVRSKRTRLSPSERRAQLISCAISAFAEHGLARATHSHVAERAGISVPAVHSYFRTREDLVTAVLDAVETELRDMHGETLNAPGSVRERFNALAFRFVQEAHDKPDLIKVWLDWSTGVRADIWPRYVALNQWFNEVAQKVLTRGKREGSISMQLNVKAAAALFIGGGHTVALMQFSGASQRDFDLFVAQLIDMILLFGLDPNAVKA
jgi:TetR/AcrR family hemagglutinin/protease transcriptional regulator